MTHNNDVIKDKIANTGQGLASQNNAIDKPRKLGLPRLHQAVAKEAEVKQAIDAQATMMENRIGLMLDTSGSMSSIDNGVSRNNLMSNYARFHQQSGKSKIELLREAISSFVSQCDFNNTSISMETFPYDDKFRLGLTTFEPILTTTIMSLQAGGGTPLSMAMDFVIRSYSLTRAIIVSDGDADSPQAARDIAEHYKESATPVDCVHIGMSPHGEELLRYIAEQTGGLFIKFEDVQNFAKNFAYLTPQKRASLFLSGAAAMLGAKEIK